MVVLNEGVNESLSYLTSASFTAALEPKFPDSGGNLVLEPNFQPNGGRKSNLVASAASDSTPTLSTKDKAFIIEGSFSAKSDFTEDNLVNLITIGSDLTTFSGAEYEDPNVNEEVDISVTSTLVFQQQ